MERKGMTDREVYPALCITAAILAVGYLLWRDILGSPTISGCWIWANFHVYCPGCGGTRALEALFRGQLLRAFYFHPAVPVIVGAVGTYLLSQTIWRLRGRRGWVLHYDPCWPLMLVGLLLANCAVRNILWLGFGIPL